MKKTILSICMALSALGMMQAQVLTKADAAMVYYMPKTYVVFDVEYNKVECAQGPFYQYAEKYLGVQDVVTGSGTKYELVGVNIRVETEADDSRAYKFEASKTQAAALVLTSKGTLAAYNAEPAQCAAKKLAEKPAQRQTTTKAVMPFSEETLLATSKAKMAESTAKQIYHIRESRLNLLAGEVEHMPADGKAMKLVLDELDKQEAALVSLFIGTTTTTTLHKQIRYLPEEDVEGKTLLRFSQHNGPVAEDDMSGEALNLTVVTSKQTLAEPGEKDKAVATSQIYYNMPGAAQMTITKKDGTVVADKRVAVAQFGVSVALPKDLISRRPQIVFNAKTGAIESINEGN